MKLAEKFARPIITFIDLPGAFPGLGAEERGQAEAIARNLREMARLQRSHHFCHQRRGRFGRSAGPCRRRPRPASPDALYFVISPEGCASIMWNDANKKTLAAEAMRISAPEVASLGCVDEIVAEPQDGIHTDREAGPGVLGSILRKHLDELKAMPVDALVVSRQQKFRNIGQFYTQN